MQHILSKMRKAIEEYQMIEDIAINSKCFG